MSTPAEAISEPVSPTTPARSDRFPGGIPYIVGNEGAERFSFYGMKAILFIYMSSLFLRFADESTLAKGVVDAAHARATAVVHLFVAAVYAFPMIGAILSDRLLGKYRVIFWVSLVYCAGHAMLAVAGGTAKMGSYSLAEWGMYAGLAAIAIGSGGIKPCVSANVGDQFTSENAHLVSKVFNIFYFMINFGSFLATIAIPLFYEKFGADVAFGVPGILMGIATLVFWMGRKKFVKVPAKPGGKLGLLDFATGSLLFVPFIVFAFFGVIEDGVAKYFIKNGLHDMGAFFSNFFHEYSLHLVIAAAGLVAGIIAFSVRQKMQEDNGFLAVLAYSFKHRKERKEGQGFFDVAREKFGDDAAEGPAAVLRIMMVFSMVSVFWALFDQSASTWVNQANQMELGLNVPGRFFYGFFLPGVLAAAVFGGVWIFSWVGNRAIPRKATLTFLAALAVWGVGATVAQLMGGGMSHIDLQASQLQAYNPLMVMVIIPLMSALVYQPLERRGTPMKPLQKMTIGMFMAAAGFAIAALLQMRIEALAPSGVKVHALWQVLQYLVMTTSEVLVSITGLEFAYTQAPRSMKSTIMGFWLLTVTIGDLIVAFMAPLETKLTLSQFFWTFTVMMAVAATLFAVMAMFYKGKTYLQEAAPGH